MIAVLSSIEETARLSGTNQSRTFSAMPEVSVISSTRIRADVMRTPGASASQPSGNILKVSASKGRSATSGPKIV